jgi:alkanesulfonate monooxygenase SsuD/methylene tetrahydromethanopterin reductase-like flavin-dependent oxidoreductase (luciferase family)
VHDAMGSETIWRRFRRKAAARGRALPQPAPAISSSGAPDTKEAEALAAALNHSSERAQTLWFSFLTFMLYLAIAIGTTTHRMLFREDPLNLPVLNIPLPLVAFYILTPIIYSSSSIFICC